VDIGCLRLQGVLDVVGRRDPQPHLLGADLGDDSGDQIDDEPGTLLG
jgi:hypothetical protein